MIFFIITESVFNEIIYFLIGLPAYAYPGLSILR